MRANVATVAAVAVVAFAALWAKTCAEASHAGEMAAQVALEEAPADHSAWLTYAAAQPAPGSAAGDAAERLGTLSGHEELGFFGRAGSAASQNGSRHLFRSAPEGTSPHGPNRGWSLLASLLFLAWLTLAGLWAWRGHARDGSPRPGRWRLGAACGICLVAWVVSAWLV